jgi:putative transposase
MWNEPPERRHPRLDAERYADVSLICSVTIVVRDRAPAFANATLAEAVVEVLREHAARTEVVVYVYCVMPDHAHLVLSASARCDLITFVGQFKNLAQRAAWRHGFDGKLWQTSFWDRFLRHADQLETAIAYVIHNPVRRGLVEVWTDYPHSGSLVFPLRAAGFRTGGDGA